MPSSAGSRAARGAVGHPKPGSDPTPQWGAARTLVAAGLACSVVDGLWAATLALLYGRSVAGLFHGVATTALGRTLGMSPSSVLMGVAVHFGVAFWWAAVFWTLTSRYRWLRARLSTPSGVAAIAAVYGPMIWVAMSVAVIPLRTGGPPSFTLRWWIQLVGHATFVGLPIVGVIAWFGGRRSNDHKDPGAA